MDKKSIVTGIYNYIDTFHAEASYEDQFQMLVKLCKENHNFVTDNGDISKPDMVLLAMYVANAKFYTDHKHDPTEKEIADKIEYLLEKFYPQYTPVYLPISDESSDEPLIPENEENPAPPKGIDPNSIIQMEEVQQPTTVNMDGDYIPQFKPMSIPLDDTQQQPVIDPTNPALMYFRGMPFPQPPVVQSHPAIHRVDNPAIQRPPMPETDKVNADLSKINISGLMKPPVEAHKPEFVQNLPHPVETAGETKSHQNSIDNSEIIRKYPKLYLGHIESLANANECSVFYEEYPAEGIISVTVLDSQDKVMPWKSFCIDNGKIIDPRIKLIAGNPKFDMNRIIEDMPFHELFNGSQKGKVLDTRLLEDIFQAGLENITKKRMYPKNYQGLNKKLALITLPTSFLDKEARKSLQDYILKMDKDGYFDKAISMSPGCRFVFATKRLDTKHLSRFTLINEGVPMYYGGPVPENLVPIIIESNDGKIDIRTNGNGDPNAIPAIKYEHP